jgi:hypothetical protein
MAQAAAGGQKPNAIWSLNYNHSMSLIAALAQANTEEDVKDAYVQALGLKSVSKGLIDIQTDECWFEAKLAPTPPAAMFAQLLSYVRAAVKKGDDIPPFLAVLDREKAALMETRHALPLFKDKDIAWSTAASQISKETIKQIQPYIEAHFVVYEIDTHESEFIEAVKTGIREGTFIRTPITPDNLKQVFDKWVQMIGKELERVAEVDYALMFYADIMHDGKNRVIQNLPVRLYFDGDLPVFALNDKSYDLTSSAGYRRFWAIYHRPPEQAHREYLLERRDSLLPVDERSFKGAYYTPLKVVDKAYDLLAKTLGKNWQQHYIVWDMCCGVGNLEVKHSNHRNVFMSTLDQADIDVMKAARTCVAATQFQYDYLNDDIDIGFGCQFDYNITNKVPLALRQAIADSNAKVKGAKKILVLMNPPYAESGAGIGEGNKAGVAKTKAASCMMQNYGKASNELFTQFIVRISQEIPNATIAVFSKLKYVNSPNFAQLRHYWKAKYLGGFVVPSQAFDGLKGKFPIGFLIWDTSKKNEIVDIETDVFDKNALWSGTKHFYNFPNEHFLSKWIDRPKTNQQAVVPLSNAISVSHALKISPPSWSDNAIAYLLCDSNDMQHAGQTALFSSVYRVGHDGGFFVNQSNLLQAAVTYSVRRLIKPTWLNDRDQFLQPSEPLTPSFKTDCLVWMLFNGSNLTASANGLEWNNAQWNIVNHFIPFTEVQVGAKSRFESAFMVEYLKDKKLSLEAQAVMNAGREVWRAYHATQFERKIRDEYKLNRTDVGWYQIRKALETAGKESGTPFDFSIFKTAYDVLSNKLRPLVFELGFLK